ncbi:MAG: hypothetical protein LBC38_01115 [Oscillospiraceae bacterium]|nr:hypothetical protein [Oscillospiraceae bacterium]
MKINSARVIGDELCLHVGRYDAERFVSTAKFPGEYELKIIKGRRSLNANSYCWTLIDKIALKMNLPKTVIYRNAILEIGGVSEILKIRGEAVGHFVKDWESRGIGYQTQIGHIGSDGVTDVIVYYGSSSYDTAQMSALINSLVEDARNLGIETLTEAELSRLSQEMK